MEMGWELARRKGFLRQEKLQLKEILAAEGREEVTENAKMPVSSRTSMIIAERERVRQRGGERFIQVYFGFPRWGI